MYVLEETGVPSNNHHLAACWSSGSDACLGRGLTGFDSRWVRGKKEIYFLAAFQSLEDTLSCQSSQPRALVACVSCN